MNTPHAPTDTRAALQSLSVTECSRSLYFDRFARPETEKEERRDYFKDGLKTKSIPLKRDTWLTFLRAGLGQMLDDLLFGKLQARLMVNMAGGVMENAGLCLDRFGIPYIPGSAVKGCARRMAIQQLFESGAGFQPPQPEDITAKSKRWEQCAELLVRIARVFGWGDLDWSHKQKDGRFISDFAYACGQADWDEIREPAVKALFTAFPNWKPDTGKPLWQSLPNFAGSVSFLPAYPVQAPNPDLELDVVTCHHREYYAGNPQFADAPDTEEPVPVVFPAVAPGHVFVFAVVPLHGCDAQLLKQARDWLKTGLETFGLGAKTNAGYGWFDCSEAVQNTGQEAVHRHLKKKQAEAEEQRKAQAEAETKARAEKERLTRLPAHERFKDEYSKLADEPFATQAKKFTEMTDDQRHGFILALKEKKETAKRWAKKKPELIKPWQDYAKKLQPPIELP